MRSLALLACLVVLLLQEPTQLTLACAIGCAMALAWLSYHGARQFCLVLVFVYYVLMGDDDHPLVH